YTSWVGYPLPDQRGTARVGDTRPSAADHPVESDRATLRAAASSAASFDSCAACAAPSSAHRAILRYARTPPRTVQAVHEAPCASTAFRARLPTGAPAAGSGHVPGGRRPGLRPPRGTAAAG